MSVVKQSHSDVSHKKGFTKKYRLHNSSRRHSGANGAASNTLSVLRRKDAATSLSQNRSSSQLLRVHGHLKYVQDGITSAVQNFNVTTVNQQIELPACPDTLPQWKQIVFHNVASPWSLLSRLPGLREVHEGHWKPEHCENSQRLALIIAYRERDEHLRVLLRHLHPFLQRQQLDYGIFVVEQVAGSRFNRAALFNVGYHEANKESDYDCFIFHDVDLVPENEQNIYRCGDRPRHLSAAIDKFNYRLPYATIFGGVIAISRDQFESVNGFSNLFFGWGGEDDDMFLRLQKAQLPIVRYPLNLARYRMIKHTNEQGNRPNPLRYLLLRHSERLMKSVGLSSDRYKQHPGPCAPNPQAAQLVRWMRVSLIEPSRRSIIRTYKL